jgi:hypothetical protein
MNTLHDKRMTVLGFVAMLAVALVYLNHHPQTEIASATVTDNLRGFAWSENIGWISLNNIDNTGAPDYGVNVSPARNLSGFAWSENIGWVSFNAADVVGCPSGQCAPTLDPVSGNLRGWARALSPTGSAAANAGGWDGWISLSGNTTTGDAYAVQVDQNCNYNGFAWGSDVIGWISFNGGNGGNVRGTDPSSCPPPAVAFTASGCSVPNGGSVLGDSVCSGNASWTFYRGTPAYSVRNDTTGVLATDGTLESGINKAFPMRFGTNVITARDNSSSPAIQSLTTTAQCEPGTTQTTPDPAIPNNNICLTTPPPIVLTISADPTIVRRGATAEVEIEVLSTEELSCQVVGVDTAPLVFSYSGPDVNINMVRDFTTRPVENKQLVNVTCAMILFPSISASREFPIEVVGNLEEI